MTGIISFLVYWVWDLGLGLELVIGSAISEIRNELEKDASIERLMRLVVTAKRQRQAGDKAHDVEEALHRQPIATDGALTTTHFSLSFFGQLRVDWLGLHRILICFHSESMAL